MSVVHPRTLIRKAAAQILTGATDAGPSVFTNRVEPFINDRWQQELPAINVFTMDEQSEVFNESPLEYRRVVQLVIEIQAAANALLDDVLDTIARQAEIALSIDDSLNGTTERLEYSDTRMVLREEGEELIGACRITFDANYIDALPPEGEPVLDDFLRARVDYNLAGEQDPDDQATDEFTVRDP